MGDKSDKQIDNCANKTAGAQRAFRKSECWHQAQEGTWRGGWGRNRENPEQKPKACDARERVPAQAREAIEEAEQGRGLVGQELGGDLEGNPPKSESHAKDRKLAKTGCPNYLLSGKRASCLSPAWGGGSGKGAGGNLGKTRTKASQAVGSEGPRELSWDSKFGVLECCGVIFISLGINPFIQKYLIDEQRHKKNF